MHTRAQYSELGVFGGMSHFIGDVGHYGIHLPQGYSTGIFFRNQFNEYYSIRGQFMYGLVANDDALSNLAYRQNRNLNFQSTIYEGAIILEFNFFEYETGSQFNHSPYIFAGLGFFTFNPQTTFDGELVDLQPLGTEGQGTSLSSRRPYGLNAINLPFGFGYRFTLNYFMGLNIECGFRNTSTDFLDDVSGKYVNPSQLSAENGELAAALSDRSLADIPNAGRPRGNGQNNDWYVFTGIGLTIKLSSKRERCLKIW